jgi:uncharacterized protein YbjT (DUF2867 family)
MNMTLLVIFLLYAILLSVGLGVAGFRSKPAVPRAEPAEPPARILVIGATGGTGRELVSQALADGLQVTALVRNPARLALEHPQLTVVQGDVLDTASVAAAMRGQQAVLCALGHKRFFYPTRILSEGTRNLLRAMEDQGVRRLVCETSMGIGDAAGRMGLYYTLFTIPVILPWYFWDKTRQERLVASSAVDWVIVRPAVLTNGAATGRYRHGPGLGSWLLTRRVARADVADFMLRQLSSNRYLGTAPAVSN